MPAGMFHRLTAFSAAIPSLSTVEPALPALLLCELQLSFMVKPFTERLSRHSLVFSLQKLAQIHKNSTILKRWQLSGNSILLLPPHEYHEVVSCGWL